jgi:hypothetical protein
MLRRGTSLAAAGIGALITKESAHFPAEGMSSAAFRHGPLEMLGASLYALVFAGNFAPAALNNKWFETSSALVGGAAPVGKDAKLAVFRLPRAPASIRPVLEILPVQMWRRVGCQRRRARPLLHSGRPHRGLEIPQHHGFRPTALIFRLCCKNNSVGGTERLACETWVC